MAFTLLTPLYLVACTTIRTPVQQPTPTLVIPPQPPVTRPPLLIQYCDDDTGSYPHRYFPQANALIATSLSQAVSANQQGVTLFATVITRNTFSPENTLDPAFTIPSIPAYPTPPTPYPTKPPDNPVFDNATATAVHNETQNAITQYNQAIANITRSIQGVRSDVTADTKRLTAWNPPVDTVATSVLGCFQLAASRFKGQPDTKMIYIASDLENNTDIDYTQSFVTSHALSGAIVHVIYFVSPSAARDQEKRAQWCPYLKAAGAKTVLFSDPAVPFDFSLFDKDANAPATSC